MLRAADMGLLLQRGCRRGIRSIRRDRAWGRTLLLLTAVMLLMQMLLALLLGVEGVNRMLTARAALRIEVLPTARDQDIQSFYAAMREDPAVEEVSFVTREQAYAEQKSRDPDLAAFLEEYKLDNPFPDSFVISLTSLDAYDAFLATVQQERWRSVIQPSFLSTLSAQERDVRTLLQVTEGVRVLTETFIVLAFAVLCFLVIEWAARVIARKSRVVLFEHLLGAPTLAVALPCIVEMTILLLTSLLIATLLLLGGLWILPMLMPALALEAAFGMFREHVVPLLWSVLPLLVLLEAIMMPLLAFGGAMLGIRTYVPSSFLFSA